MRLILSCPSAARFPNVRDSTATAVISGAQPTRTAQNAPRNNRSRSAKLAELEATLTYAEMGVGAPSYTSGAHWWDGTAATLNSTPTETVRIAITTSKSPGGRCASDSAMALRFVEPDIP